MKVLELFSGTHSIGKVCHDLGWEVVSLDRDLGNTSPFHDYRSDTHIKEDIMTWDYKKSYKIGEFDLITASPVCLWWSKLRDTWIGRKLKSHGDKIITKEILQEDIDKYGKPMVDKVFEIIEYFKPQYWWIENPKTGKMKNYIFEKYPQYDIFYDIDYCKYSDWGYQKRTRFWTNIKNFDPKICKKDCDNILTIPTQEGAIHIGTKKPIKSSTRTLHKNPIGNKDKAKVIHKVQVGMLSGNNIKKESKVHSHRMGMSKINKERKKHMTDTSFVGGGSNRLFRYRIPEKFIQELLLCII
tara:strand:+ start:3272 stop:4165 length:894 start_codon:yes stop_codon:yes gene_type:complete